MSNVLLLIINMINLFLRSVQSHEDCPDGICEEPLATAGTLETQLRSPNVNVGIGVFDLVRLMRCIPMDRVAAVAKRIAGLFKECDRCPDGECSFFDILGCLDLGEAVDIVKEVLSIIQDSYICDGEGSDEITLGQAAE
jgi:hypothetical protein